RAPPGPRRGHAPPPGPSASRVPLTGRMVGRLLFKEQQQASRHADLGMTPYEEWSRAGWAAHLPGVDDIPAHVAALGNATIPGLAAASADRVPDRVAPAIDGEPITH